MRSKLACLSAALLLLQPLAVQYRTALPGYRYEFPRDHFNHPDFQTEWRYYTGNLRSGEGHRFGFELTFFRQAISRDPAKAGAWDVKDIYLAHLSLSDLDGGTSWMNHEFSTHQLEADQTGWDWLSLQFDGHTEVMLFHIRGKDGSIDPHSAGTYVDANGKTTHLRSSDFSLEPAGDKWTSPLTGAAYPIHWKIAIPKLAIELDAKTPLASQELTSSTKLAPNYWEGAIVLSGQRKAEPLSGLGYLEMTGYDRAVQVAK